MDNQKFETENLEVLIAVLGITMETRSFQQLHNPTQLQQIIAVNWMEQKENSWREVVYWLLTVVLARLDPAVLLICCSPH